MAKSEMPSIIVSSGSNSNHCCTNHMERRQLNKLSRLAKQEEFELDESCAPSPVTIHIEDRGDGSEEAENKSSGCCRGDDDEEDDGDGNNGCRGDDDMLYEGNGTPGSQQTTAGNGAMPNNKADKQSRRMKLLVRSQAVRDDTSPPPDIDSVTSNTNMLSVSNASLYSSQPQAKGTSNRHRMGRQGSSQGSADGSSPSLSRDSSTETYTDSTGIDLQQFLIDTLQKNCKDRIMLLKIEQELTTLVKDGKRVSFKFPQMSSYNRMLVHRVAAFFGLDHNVDQNGTAVIVNKTANTRIPDMKFRDQIKDELMLDEPKKSILKRDSASFEEGKEKSPERQFSADNKRSKSFEEREEEYEKARARIFNQDSSSSQEGAEIPVGQIPESLHSSSQRSSQEDLRWVNEPRPWSSTDSDSSGRPIPQGGMKAGGSFEAAEGGLRGSGKPGGIQVLVKSESDSKEVLTPGRVARPAVTKASSFGGISVLSRDSNIGGGRGSPPVLMKAESFNVTTGNTSRFSPNTPPQGMTQAAPPPPLQTSTSPVTHSPSPKPQASGPGQTSMKNSSSATPSNPPVFPLVPGQMQVPLQQPSSQTSWQAGNREPSVPTEMLNQPVGQPTLWPWPSIDSIPAGSIILNPPLGTHYVGSDAPVFRPRSAPGLANPPVLVAPYQQVPATNLQPLQMGGQIQAHHSPQQQHQLPPQPPSQQQQQPPPPTPQQSLTQQQQHQPLPPSQAPATAVPPPAPTPQQQQQLQHAFQTTPTVVYIPCVPSSPIQSTLPPPQVPFQQGKGSQHQCHEAAADQRQEARGTGDLVSQMCSLNLAPSPQVPPESGTCASGVDSNASAAPQGQQNLILPSVRNQGGFMAQAGNVSQVPLCYVPQQQPAGTSPQAVQYIYPAGQVLSTSIQPPVSNSSAVVIGNQSVVDVSQNQVVSQANNQQITGQYYIPTYPLYSYSHSGETSSSSQSPYLSYTIASQSNNSSTTSTTMVSTASLSLPLYPYTGMVVTSVPNGTSALLSSPCTSQANQATNFVSPLPLHTPTSALPLYVVATNNTATPVAIPPGGTITGSPCPTFRPSTPPNLSTSANHQTGGSQPIPLGSPLVGYTIYTPAIQPSQPQPPPAHQQQQPPTQGTHGPASSSHFPLVTFPILRPTIPLLGNMQNNTHLPPNQSQFSTSPAAAVKSHTAFPFGRNDALHSGDSLVGGASGSGGHDQHKGARNTPLHLGTAANQVAPGGSVYRRGISLMQGKKNLHAVFNNSVQHKHRHNNNIINNKHSLDMRLIGPPLQHQINPLLLSQQRSLLRFPHPHTQSAAASLGNRTPKMRKQRNKGNAGGGVGGSVGGGGGSGGGVSGTGSRGENSSLGSQPSGDANNGGYVLEVEGLPDCMKRSEVERYLEQVTSLGAKIQFVCEATGRDAAGSGSTTSSSQSGDFVVNSKFQVLAIFESETAAQSALLSIKTPKFQLRPLRRGGRRDGPPLPQPLSKNL